MNLKQGPRKSGRSVMLEVLRREGGGGNEISGRAKVRRRNTKYVSPFENKTKKQNKNKNKKNSRAAKGASMGAYDGRCSFVRAAHDARRTFTAKYSSQVPRSWNPGKQSLTPAAAPIVQKKPTVRIGNTIGTYIIPFALYYCSATPPVRTAVIHGIVHVTYRTVP